MFAQMGSSLLLGFCFYLYLVFHISSKMLNHKGRLLHRGTHKELVMVVLLFKLLQEGAICGVRKTREGITHTIFTPKKPRYSTHIYPK